MTPQNSPQTIQTDVLIFGGGAAGLWTLDLLTRSGYHALLIEAHALGQGQTVASQGIIHGGLKYTLTGALTSSAQFIRQMPLIWRECFAGRQLPDLSHVIMRSQFCHLWRTESLMSQLGMVGARVGLRVKPNKLDRKEWPAALANCPGSVYKLDEQVMSPASFVQQLAAPHLDRILLASPQQTIIETSAPGVVSKVTLTHSDNAAQASLVIQPRIVLLTAGQGNADLRQTIGLDGSAMQRRPLHMVMAKGSTLPQLNGHCVDGAKTRVTITTDTTSDGLAVWQVGGQISEDGVAMDEQTLLRHAINEVNLSIPGLDLSNVQWATYRVDRAEATTDTGRRPDDVHLTRQGNTFTAWPTKLALAPRLASHLLEQLDKPDAGLASQPLPKWPRPDVAAPPWETASQWHTTRQITTGQLTSQ